MTSRVYRVHITWSHRKYGPDRTSLKAEGTSIRRAINHALVAFFTDEQQRKQRLDAHREIRVEAWRLPKEKNR